MRTLSATLDAAQKSPSREPYVQVKVTDRIPSGPRIAWTRLYTGSETPNAHDACFAGDGSLQRVRIGAASKVYRQRVASPGPGSDFSVWADTGQVSLCVAVCALGANVHIFYYSSSTIYELVSADYGQTFAAPSSVCTIGATYPADLAAAFKPNGDIALFYIQINNLGVCKRVSGVWGSPSAWIPASNLSAVACCYNGDWNIILTGINLNATPANDYFVAWSLIYGDGGAVAAGSWSKLKPIASMDYAAGAYRYNWPSIKRHTLLPCYFVTFAEVTATYNYPFIAHSLEGADFIDALYIEPEALDYSSAYGVAIAVADAAYIWLSAPDGVWRAVISTTYADVDLSTDVLKVVETVYRYSDRATVELRNDALQYQSPGAGSLAPLATGSQLTISPGCRTTAGIDVSTGPTYWLRGWEYISEGDKATFVLHARGGWELLAAWRSRYHFHFNNPIKNPNEAAFIVLEMVRFLVARSGLAVSVISQSAGISATPDYSINLNARGRNRVEALLALVSDVLFFTAGEGKIKDPLPGEASSYSYGVAHALYEGRYRSFPWDINQVQALGRDPTTGAPLLLDSLGRVFELIGEETDDWREAEIQSLSGEILVPANCGQEPYDVIDITDPRADLSAEKRRVMGLTLTFHPQRARFDHLIDLGAV